MAGCGTDRSRASNTLDDLFNPVTPVNRLGSDVMPAGVKRSRTSTKKSGKKTAKKASSTTSRKRKKTPLDKQRAAKKRHYDSVITMGTKKRAGKTKVAPKQWHPPACTNEGWW